MTIYLETEIRAMDVAKIIEAIENARKEGYALGFKEAKEKANRIVESYAGNQTILGGDILALTPEDASK